MSLNISTQIASLKTRLKFRNINLLRHKLNSRHHLQHSYKQNEEGHLGKTQLGRAIILSLMYFMELNLLIHLLLVMTLKMHLKKTYLDIL